MIELPDHPWFVAGQFHPEFRSRPTRPHPLFRDFVGAATAFADNRDRSASAAAPGVRSDGVPVHRNGGEPAPARPWDPEPVAPAQPPGQPRADEPAAAQARAQADEPRWRAEEPGAVPRVPIIDANPRPDLAGRVPSARDGAQPANPAQPENAAQPRNAALPANAAQAAPALHPSGAGAPEREGSREPGAARTAVHSPAPAASAEPPATVDLRGDELADPVRHDDDPPVPTGPVTAGG
jgi:hypothetical protein